MTHLFNPERGALFDLSERVKLRITGSDTLRFLNGQISNDLRKAAANVAIQASVLNAKGKLNAEIFISAENDSFLLDADPALRNALPARLDRYVIADDVRIEDVTDQFAMFHLTGEPEPDSAVPGRVLRATRFGCPGWDIWVDPAAAEQTRQELCKTVTFCDEECAEVFRIERGVPRWGRELTEQIIPNEANLEASSIDYAKGCYIGQEVISRMKMSGQTNKRLCGLVSLSGAPLQAGLRLTPGEGDEKEIGWITSAVRSRRLEQEIALGFVKRGFNSAGTRLQARSPEGSTPAGGIPVDVVILPFA